MYILQDGSSKKKKEKMSSFTVSNADISTVVVN